MTTSALIVNRGPLDIEVAFGTTKRTLKPYESCEAALWHGGQYVTILEVPPTKKELSP